MKRLIIYPLVLLIAIFFECLAMGSAAFKFNQYPTMAWVAQILFISFCIGIAELLSTPDETLRKL